MPVNFSHSIRVLPKRKIDGKAFKTKSHKSKSVIYVHVVETETVGELFHLLIEKCVLSKCICIYKPIHTYVYTK